MTSIIRDEFIRGMYASLDEKARENFGSLDQVSLARSMRICGMEEYPPVTGDPDGERMSGEMTCERCSLEYYAHPMDWRVIGYGDVPFLNVLCDGRRVKL